MKLDSRGYAKRLGFTLIEVIIVVLIVCLAIAFLLPAVQSARESARRLQCTANLKQLGVAVMNYESMFSVWPRGEGRCSPNASLLPYLEQRAPFNAINFNASTTTIILPNEANFTVGRQNISVFLCPSDPVIGDEPGASYLANWGVGFNDEGAIPNGPFAYTPDIFPFGPRHASDGTSLTAAFSEACHGIRGSFDIKRHTARTPKRMTEAPLFEKFASECDSLKLTDFSPKGPLLRVRKVMSALDALTYTFRHERQRFARGT